MIMAVLATAYCLAGVTASGEYVHPGAVAVDPQIIRLGSHLHIPGYGRGRAIDTGSAVRGRHIDVWFASCARARAWGSRYISIRVFR